MSCPEGGKAVSEENKALFDKIMNMFETGTLPVRETLSLPTPLITIPCLVLGTASMVSSRP